MTLVFIMISGALILPSDKSVDPAAFLRRRGFRIGLPFLFWAFVYFFLENRDTVVADRSIPILSFLHELVTGEVFYHLWFISPRTGRSGRGSFPESCGG